MSDINQFALSQILGSKMRPVKQARFGNFGLLETTAESLRAQSTFRHRGEDLAFTYDHDRVVCQAFEQVRQGASPDSILWDRILQTKFTERCRELGLDAPDAFLNRRLINIRKNKGRYEKHGIRLTPTTASEPHPSIVARFAHVIEFALVRLRYRYGVSIDEILLDPELSNQFEETAQEVAPQLSPRDLRLGALYLRKTRNLPKGQRQEIASLDVSVIDKTATKPQTLATLNVDNLPDGPGLVELKSKDRFLYIAKNDRLQTMVQQLITTDAFRVVGGAFWKPDPNEITLQYTVGESFEHVGASKWERRLIHDRKPVFNWPIDKTAA